MTETDVECQSFDSSQWCVQDCIPAGPECVAGELYFSWYTEGRFWRSGTCKSGRTKMYGNFVEWSDTVCDV